jgi:ectoine hydroxylase-related dioxygenase (phytanoyl-CoA dioxygenase family)
LANARRLGGLLSFFLTEGEVSDYRSSGFLLKESVFSDLELAGFRSAAEQVEREALELINEGAEHARKVQPYTLDGNRFADIDFITVQFEHGVNNQSVRVIEPVNELSERFNALIDEPRLTQPMQQIVGADDLALWTTKLNLKSAKEGSGFRWHQDSPYWIHDCNHVDQLPNVMVLFDDADESNGCLRVIQSSHKKGRLPGCEDGSQLQGFFTHPNAFSEQDQVLMEAPAGSVVFFDPHIVHGSQPNHSDSPRRAIIITYQPAGYPALKSRVVRPILKSFNP